MFFIYAALTHQQSERDIDLGEAAFAMHMETLPLVSCDPSQGQPCRLQRTASVEHLLTTIENI